MSAPQQWRPQGQTARRGKVPRKIRRRPDTDPEDGVQKYGKVRFADPTNREYPIDSPGHIKAAWAYIHQPDNASKYTSEDVRTIKIRIRRAAVGRGVTLPEPDEFVGLMRRVRRRSGRLRAGAGLEPRADGRS